MSCASVRVNLLLILTRNNKLCGSCIFSLFSFAKMYLVSGTWYVLRVDMIRVLLLILILIVHVSNKYGIRYTPWKEKYFMNLHGECCHSVTQAASVIPYIYSKYLVAGNFFNEQAHSTLHHTTMYSCGGVVAYQVPKIYGILSPPPPTHPEVRSTITINIINTSTTLNNNSRLSSWVRSSKKEEVPYY